MGIPIADNCLPEILDDLEWIDAEHGFTCYPWETTPIEFLQFAKQDFQTETKRSFINAIGHAKRAIHAHVDFLLHNCGRCLQKADFPRKLELLEQIGIVAPLILKKYNRLRNLIEHEYISPSADEARDVIEVAELFIEATRSYTRPLPANLVFRSDDTGQTCIINCDWDHRLLLITVTPADDGHCSACVVSPNSGEAKVWYCWVARILKLMRDIGDPYVKCSELRIDADVD